MSFETTKTNKIRSPEFFATYLTGRIIDIGCGPDPVVPTAEAFDMKDGDAQEIAKIRAVGAYDCVYSSHCLEHMCDVEAALAQWWSLVKPGGYLITVVPDEDLYEQGVWPSRFNPDHKATFRLEGETSWSPVSRDIRKLIASLPDVQIIAVERQDMGYDHSLKGHGESRLGQAARKGINKFIRPVFRKIGWDGTAKPKPLLRLAHNWFGVLVDQSNYGALCQIQVVAQKNTNNLL
jgi:SAM-dependent methyltransferase